MHLCALSVPAAAELNWIYVVFLEYFFKFTCIQIVLAFWLKNRKEQCCSFDCFLKLKCSVWLADFLKLYLSPELLIVFISSQEFAGEGLRTLALAYKDLSKEYYQVWQKKLHYVSTVIENREEQLAALYEEIEQGMKVKLASFLFAPLKRWILPRLTSDSVQASWSHSDRGQTSRRSAGDNRLSESSRHQDLGPNRRQAR